jgi:hypothetical protein
MGPNDPDLLTAGLADEVARLWDQLRALIDSSKISVDAILRGLEQFAATGFNLPNVLALLGVGFFVATLLARTIVPLRIAAILSDIFFMAYGVVASSLVAFLLHFALMPINVARLHQMVKLVKKARISAQGNLSLDWLKPFMARRNYRRGDFLWRKGDTANEMFYTVTGKFLVSEIGVELAEGHILGELGFITPDNRRTQTVQCIEDGTVLAITYDKLLELYFQNPEFGYYFLRLTSDRLLQNVARLESTVAQYKAKLEAADTGSGRS